MSISKIRVWFHEVFHGRTRGCFEGKWGLKRYEVRVGRHGKWDLGEMGSEVGRQMKWDRETWEVDFEG